MNTQKKLILGFGTIIILFSIIIGIAYVNINRFETSNTENLHSYKVLNQLDNINVAMINMESGQRGFALTGDENSLKPYLSGKEMVYSSLIEARKLSEVDPDQTELIDEVEKKVDEWLKFAGDQVEKKKMVKTGFFSMDDIIKVEISGKGEQLMTEVRNLLEECAALEYVKLEERSTTSENLMSVTKNIMIYGFATLILVAITISILTIKNIVRPLSEIVSLIKAIATGDFSVTVSEKLTDKNDEAGQLAKAVKVMISDLSALIEKLIHIANTVKDSAQTTSSVSDETKVASEEVTQAIEQIATSIEQQVALSNQIYKASDNLTQIIDHTHLMIGDTINRSQNANELSQRGQNVMSQLNENTFENNEKSKKVDAAIRDVNDYANNAHSIISIIETISTQTNLLALNASIEAARAGDAGRGFAVVASEIRKLAEDTMKATHNIFELINGIQEKSSHAVSIVTEVMAVAEHQNDSINQTNQIFNETKEEINQMIKYIEEVNAYIMKITESKNDILTSVKSINTLSVEHSATTEEISASAEQQLSAMEELTSLSENTKNQADELRSLVGVFKT